MHGKHLFEYAVVRIMPRVEREEFMNVGVVLYCSKQKFLKAMIQLEQDRVTAFYPLCDTEAVQGHLQAFERICTGGKGSGLIGELPLPERFRWLTAMRSTVVQTSRVHPGFCDDAGTMLEHLFNALVL